jgi:hypothetical protein
MNSKVMASCANDRDRVARIFEAYNASAEVASKKLEAVEAKQDFHVGISVVFMKSRKVTAYLQVRLKVHWLLFLCLQIAHNMVRHGRESLTLLTCSGRGNANGSVSARDF